MGTRDDLPVFVAPELLQRHEHTHTHTHTHTGIKEKLVNMEIVSILVQVMKGTTKDKVIRMIVANVLLMCC